MLIKFPKVSYQVNLYERLSDDSIGECYWSETFVTQKEVEEFLSRRASSQVFHYSVELIGGFSSWAGFYGL